MMNTQEFRKYNPLSSQCGQTPSPKRLTPPSQVTVLVVDDDPDIRNVIQLWLADCGYQVAGASNGFEALAKVKTVRPQLIILDMMMPVMDGAQVAQRLRADPQTRAIPIIVVSADPRARERLRTTSVDARLPKPFDLDELLCAVETNLMN